MRRPAPLALPREIVPLPSDRRYEAADLLGLACGDHPLVPYLAPTPGGRTRQALASAGVTLIGFGESCGEIDVTAPILDGIAIWLTPAHAWQLPARRAWELQVAAALGQGMGGFLRCLRLLGQLDRAGRQAVPVPHRQLFLLGVHPVRQDRGLEEALLRRGLERADTEGLPCTTICFRATTVLFYVHHGFAVVADGNVPDGGPHYWLLLREPGAVGGFGQG
jgi:ribosomal protein S18 acetylase RimI-like enzyme